MLRSGCGCGSSNFPQKPKLEVFSHFVKRWHQERRPGHDLPGVGEAHYMVDVGVSGGFDPSPCEHATAHGSRSFLGTRGSSAWQSCPEHQLVLKCYVGELVPEYVSNGSLREIGSSGRMCAGFIRIPTWNAGRCGKALYRHCQAGA